MTASQTTAVRTLYAALQSPEVPRKTGAYTCDCAMCGEACEK